MFPGKYRCFQVDLYFQLHNRVFNLYFQVKFWLLFLRIWMQKLVKSSVILSSFKTFRQKKRKNWIKNLTKFEVKNIFLSHLSSILWSDGQFLFKRKRKRPLLHWSWKEMDCKQINKQRLIKLKKINWNLKIFKKRLKPKKRPRRKSTSKYTTRWYNYERPGEFHFRWFENSVTELGQAA